MNSKSLFSILLILISSSLVFGQFGQNKVQYKNFEWYYIQSKHFDVYYYEGGKELAEFTAEIAEKAYEQISRDYSYDIKERIVFIVYKSHNDWQQTNVVLSYLEEGVGGVTELYKNRIVVPFEGSYEQFRHVVHHELVHGVMNDLLYSGSIQSLVMGEVVPVPLWVSEGLAEFASVGWQTQTDMIVRDAVQTGYIPPVQYMEYIMPYQAGNSVWRYIAETYGRQKIGEILNKSRGRVAFQNVLKSAIGQDYEGLTEKWHRYLRKIYAPEENNRMVPKEFSKQLTDHKKLNNFLNLSPAISPQGDKIAYISDRNGYQNVYLMSAIDGKEIKTLVNGQKSESFEELHFLRPGMSFSPDGKKLVMTAKSGAWDALYIIDVNSGDTQKYLMEMDGAFTTSWSLDGNRIAFVGNKNQKSDIYIFDLNTHKVEAMTDDIFTDDQPSWSPDGRYIAFVSDRGDYLSNDELPADFKMSEYDFHYRDIYILDTQTKSIERRTNTPWEEAFPIFSPDGKKIAFTSDESGIFNVYIQNLETAEYYPVTNIMSGVLQIGWDKEANKLVYTTFYQGGFDIYMLNNPLELKPLKLELTEYATSRESEEVPVYATNWYDQHPEEQQKKEEQPKELEGEQPADYSRYVFGSYRTSELPKKRKKVTLPEEKLMDENGDYRARKYKVKFSPDIVTGAAGYNTFFGVQGYASFAFSDLMGDHKIFLNASLWADLRNSTFSMLYYYLKRRINIGIGGYHLVYLVSGYYYNSVLRYRNYGGVFILSYPFNRYKRLDLNLIWDNVNLEYLDYYSGVQKVNTVLPEIQYVHDNVLWGVRWGILAPVSGSRYNFSVRFSPKYNSNSLEFTTFKLDYRHYFMLSQKYQFAVRGYFGASFGKNATQFFLGGMDNWINYKYVAQKRVGTIEDVFYSDYITPLRGAIYYERVGNRFFLVNMEFRFPLIEYLQLGLPPISLFNIRGSAFLDFGSAWQQSGNIWNLDGFRGVSRLPNGQRQFQDLLSGYGIGARVYFIGILLRFDVAWPNNYFHSGGPIYYWSLGLDF
ncbi:MAG: biopolymer transporter Tol [Calditrichota bacterium]